MKKVEGKKVKVAGQDKPAKQGGARQGVTRKNNKNQA